MTGLLLLITVVQWVALLGLIALAGLVATAVAVLLRAALLGLLTAVARAGQRRSRHTRLRARLAEEFRLGVWPNDSIVESCLDAALPVQAEKDAEIREQARDRVRLQNEVDAARSKVDVLNGFLRRVGYEVCPDCQGRGGTASQTDVFPCSECGGFCLVGLADEAVPDGH